MQLTDGELLGRFLGQSDERAFEELVQRHNSLVMGVCRRTLGESPEAEEAFQNTFLVLLRKAKGMTKADSLKNWLYGVAIRTSLNLRKTKIAQPTFNESDIEMLPQTESDSGKIWEELRPILDEELGRLNEKSRMPSSA